MSHRQIQTESPGRSPAKLTDPDPAAPSPNGGGRFSPLDVALSFVTQAPQDDWGRQWLIAARCLRIYDPARGKLDHLLKFAMRRARTDHLRQTHGAIRNRARPLFRELERSPEPAVSANRDTAELRELAAVAMRDVGDDLADIARFIASGMSLRDIAVALDQPLGSIKSRWYRHVKQLRALHEREAA